MIWKEKPHLLFLSRPALQSRFSTLLVPEVERWWGQGTRWLRGWRLAPTSLYVPLSSLLCPPLLWLSPSLFCLCPPSPLALALCLSPKDAPLDKGPQHRGKFLWSHVSPTPPRSEQVGQVQLPLLGSLCCVHGPRWSSYTQVSNL